MEYVNEELQLQMHNNFKMFVSGRRRSDDLPEQRDFHLESLAVLVHQKDLLERDKRHHVWDQPSYLEGTALPKNRPNGRINMRKTCCKLKKI